MRAPAAPAATTGGGRLAAVGVTGALIGATLSLGIAAAVGAFDPGTRLVEQQRLVQPVTGLTTEAQSVAAITTRTAPALAAVRVERDGTTSSGTAVAFRSDGHLVTNAHLVAHADGIDVRLHDGSVTAATVVGTDPVTDVAVLLVDGHDLEPAALGSADPLRIGDRTIVIATADGATWAPVVATGVVSALGRRLRTEDGRVLHDMMVVDVPLGAGAGGGALVDVHGAVVGLTSGLPSATDLGMATPIDIVVRVADDIVEHGRARHVWLGIEGTDMPLEDARDRSITGGAVVKRIMDASPAAAAGLLAGDVVVRVDEEAIGSMTELIAVLRRRAPGDDVVLRVHRGSEVLQISLQLAERP